MSRTVPGGLDVEISVGTSNAACKIWQDVVVTKFMSCYAIKRGITEQ
jgi:hypothetical protein